MLARVSLAAVFALTCPTPSSGSSFRTSPSSFPSVSQLRDYLSSVRNGPDGLADLFQVQHRSLAELVSMGRETASASSMSGDFYPGAEYGRELYFAESVSFYRIVQEDPTSVLGCKQERRSVNEILSIIASEPSPTELEYTDLMRAIETAVSAESPIQSATEIWRTSNGPRLVAMASTSMSKRPHLVVPLMMLVTGIGLPRADVPAFAHTQGIVSFCQSFGDDIRKALIRDHKTYHYIRKHIDPLTISASQQRFASLTTFAADFPLFCSDLFSTSLESRLVVQVQRHFRNRLVAEVYGAARLKLERVDRRKPFSSSRSKLNSISAHLGLATVTFQDEVGQGVGVIRDWFASAASEVFDVDNGFFELSEAGNYYRINTTDGAYEPKHVLTAIGSLIALSIVEEIPLGVNLPVFLFDFFADIPSTLESVDADEHVGVQSVQNVMTMSEEQLRLAELYLPISGQLITIENRDQLEGEWLRSLIPTTESLGDAYRAIKAGFRSVIIDPDFDSLDFKRAVLGSPHIDPEDLITYMELEGYTSSSLQVKWFHSLLHTWDQATLRRWITFVTGYPTLPVNGAAGFNPRLKLVRNEESTENLPRSRTCFNQFHMPVYPSEAVLADRIRVALLQDSSMGIV